ncbi:FAS1-like dehydratase domain-containing protein [Sphaerotilus sp.]|uniref:FAS1-like dehydratase domain-containing protein n=1 Tax=Sphaerotilus sp. TaxID=2093942 RepID=UPI002ACDBBA4|nr:MaoC family dehydratase N-terminal domain-containing protein [Sphaerotilus sp.]MDZ7858998.1 MaoC family dehydratase N-terminal domain-containing protein [Sphaerotilus sp.]
MSQVDIVRLRQWVGRESLVDDTLSVRQAQLMAATLGLPREALVAGQPLPPLWHWLYFLEGLPPAELGRDGHPARGGFLPPVPLANRMWAGGHLRFEADLPLGATVQKRSRIEAVEHKQGRSGELVFVTVRHDVLLDGCVALSETHDIVYKDPGPRGPAVLPPVMPVPTHSERFAPNSTLLFRYSALTFNGHRIHYDVDYCRDVEGYANLVVHGPLNATLLAAHAQRVAGQPLKDFRYRGLEPSVVGQELILHAADSESGLLVWVARPDGTVSMRADASF